VGQTKDNFAPVGKARFAGKQIVGKDGKADSCAEFDLQLAFLEFVAVNRQ